VWLPSCVPMTNPVCTPTREVHGLLVYQCYQCVPGPLGSLPLPLGAPKASWLRRRRPLSQVCIYTPMSILCELQLKKYMASWPTNVTSVLPGLWAFYLYLWDLLKPPGARVAVTSPKVRLSLTMYVGEVGSVVGEFQITNQWTYKHSDA